MVIEDSDQICASLDRPQVDHRLVGLCLAQAAAATAAALAVLIDVETILGFVPGITLLGFVVALVAIRRCSLALFLLGLLSPIVGSLVALSITIFRWSPADATFPVAVMLTLNAAITMSWLVILVMWYRKILSPNALSVTPRFRFSIRSLLIAITLIGLLLALVRHLSSQREWTLFVVYGMAVIFISVAFCLWFLRRVSMNSHPHHEPAGNFPPSAM